MLDNIRYNTKWGKDILILTCLGVTYKNIFLEITDRTKLDYFKQLRSTCRPQSAKTHTLSKASGLKRHPVQDAQLCNYKPCSRLMTRKIGNKQ